MYCSPLVVVVVVQAVPKLMCLVCNTVDRLFVLSKLNFLWRANDIPAPSTLNFRQFGQSFPRFSFMPPIPTKPKSKQKTGRRGIEEFSFDGGHAREIEQKRNSGQISCAECRRCVFVRSSCDSCQTLAYSDLLRLLLALYEYPKD